MLRVSYTTHTTNAEILNRVGLKRPTVVVFYQRGKLCYFGHVMKHESIDRTTVEGIVQARDSGSSGATTSKVG